MAINPEKKGTLPGPPFPEPTLLINPSEPPLLPVPPGLTSTDPSLASLRKFAVDVLSENSQNLHNSSQSLRLSYLMLSIMYCILFAVGVVTAAAAVFKGLQATNGVEVLPPLVLAGLSVGSFFTLFIVRPLESLERNTILSTWLMAALNTYWTELLYINDQKNAYTDLKNATDDLMSSLNNLADRYAAANAKYAPLTSATATTTTNPTSGPKAADGTMPATR